MQRRRKGSSDGGRKKGGSGSWKRWAVRHKFVSPGRI
jgi:hypothetical protein